MKKEKDRLKRKFVDSVSDLLQPNQFAGTSLYKFLLHHRNKSQNYQIDIHEILIEGVKRGIDLIDQTGEPIEYSNAWLRVTCLNVLRDTVKEIVREEKKFKDLSVIRQLDAEPLPKPELIEQLEYLDLAMQKLSEDDRLIINLRFFQGKSYEQIQEFYVSYCESKIPLSTLRKRESRAMKKLRKHFLRLYNEEVLT